MKNHSHLYVCYLIMKDAMSDFTGSVRLQRITDCLAEAQAFYENMHCKTYEQAFVYGNKEAAIRNFMPYLPGFRAAFDERAITACPPEDEMVLACSELQDLIAILRQRFGRKLVSDENCKARLVVISDMGAGGEGRQAEYMASRLGQLKQEMEAAGIDFSICFLDADSGGCEGCLSDVIDAYELI